MRLLGLGFILLVIAAATHAAQPEESVVGLKLDLITVQAAELDVDRLPRTTHYRFTASIVSIQSADTAHFGLGFNSASPLIKGAEQKKDVTWATSANWERFLGSDRTSFSPRLRLESKGQQLEIRLRRHSVWIQWRKDLP